MTEMENDKKPSALDIPYYEINKTEVERMNKRKSGVSIMDIRNLFLWIYTMDTIPPSWIFVGNKPSLNNITFVIANEEDAIHSDIFHEIDSQSIAIPVRSTPIPDMWDQYLLYGLQQSKRSRSDVISSAANSEDSLPFMTMCLSKEEMRNNEYIVIQDDELRQSLKKDGYLFVEEKDEVFQKKTITVDNLIAIDCEMVETKGGHDELARVSIVSNKKVLLDEYVLPEREVTDYRTQYSGITPAILKECKNKFSSIQQRVYEILTKQPSIVVGHSLENDLSVLKIVHSHVIDTSILYKHPSPGYKHSLRYLTTTYLNRSIQNQNGGHDSIEDAKAALDLTVYYSQGGIGFKKSFEDTQPYPNRRTCLLQSISKANPRQRIVFMGWNDYVMNVSQTSSVGDMMVLKNHQTVLSKLKALSRSSNFPRFTYVYNIEYHYAQINNQSAEKDNQKGEPLDLKELWSVFKECYPKSLLFVLLMKKSFSNDGMGGQFLVLLNK